MPDETPLHISEDTRLLLRALSQTRDALRNEQQRQGMEQAARITAIESAMKDLMSQFKEAFPEGDAPAHRRYHESVMNFRRRLGQILWAWLQHLTLYGGTAAIVWIAITLWKSPKGL